MNSDDAPTATELRALIAHLLAGAAGGSEERWAALVGEVEKLPIAMHPRCNWRVVPGGSASEQEAIGKAIELVRGQHPYVRSPTA